MNISPLAKIMLADVWERLEGMRVGGKSRSDCPLRDEFGFDWTGGVDGEKQSCFRCEWEAEPGFGVQSSEG